MCGPTECSFYEPSWLLCVQFMGGLNLLIFGLQIYKVANSLKTLLVMLCLYAVYIMIFELTGNL